MIADFMVGSEGQPVFRQMGIRSMSTCSSCRICIPGYRLSEPTQTSPVRYDCIAGEDLWVQTFMYRIKSQQTALLRRKPVHTRNRNTAHPEELGAVQGPAL